MSDDSRGECGTIVIDAQHADDEKLVDVQDVLLPVSLFLFETHLQQLIGRFHELYGGHPAADRVRNQRIPDTPIQLDTLGQSPPCQDFSAVTCCFSPSLPSHVLIPDEAFTSENWIVRIYQVKKEDSFGRDLRAANAFNGGVPLKKAPSAAISSAPGSGAAAGGKKQRKARPNV